MSCSLTDDGDSETRMPKPDTKTRLGGLGSLQHVGLVHLTMGWIEDEKTKGSDTSMMPMSNRFDCGVDLEYDGSTQMVRALR